MVPVSEYKTLDIKLDRVNSYIPPIVVNEADNNGRRLKFTPTYEGQPVTGITSARMYYDPRPRDASSIGDYVDGTKDGDGWVFVIPPNTFTAGVQGIASVSFTDADGETYTRSMPIEVESGGTKIDSQGTRIDRLIATLEQMVNDFTMTAETETGPAGSKASVNVTRLDNGSYNLDFTIPTGEKGPKGDTGAQGPKGDKGDKGEPGDLTTVAHDATLTGDGTSGSPLGVVSGTAMNPVSNGWSAIDFNDFTENGVYTFDGDPTNGPNVTPKWITGTLIVSRSFQRTAQLCLYYPNDNNKESFAFRSGGNDSIPNITWGKWHQIAFLDDLPDATALANEKGDIASLSTRVQALEARIKSLGTN